MQSYSLPYGKSTISLYLEQDLKVNVILPAKFPENADPLGAVSKSLMNPYGGFNLAKTIKHYHNVAIAINDQTRLSPDSILLPPLLKMLEDCGIKRTSISIFIASGTHIPLEKNEFITILPQKIISNYQVCTHDCDDHQNLFFLGNTSRGTPVYINKQFSQADLKIVVGVIEPHHFQGFSGGVKTAAIGLAGRKTIDVNHSLMLDKNSFIGSYDLNPCRQDVEEIGDLIGIDCALDVILNTERKIINVLWGKPREVMRIGIGISKKACKCNIKKKYDLVIASPGGHPKDINLYQSQKALTHAGLFAKENGVIILAAACPEGTGSQLYDNYMKDMVSFSQVIERFQNSEFHVGPHKAFQIAKQGTKNKIILVSDMPADKVRKTLLSPAATLQEAFSLSLKHLLSEPTVAILPHATNTIIL